MCWCQLNQQPWWIFQCLMCMYFPGMRCCTWSLNRFYQGCYYCRGRWNKKKNLTEPFLAKADQRGTIKHLWSTNYRLGNSVLEYLLEKFKGTGLTILLKVSLRCWRNRYPKPIFPMYAMLQRLHIILYMILQDMRGKFSCIENVNFEKDT